MKVLVILQPGGCARMTPEQEEAVRAQAREQAALALPVLVLPPGLGFGVAEVDDARQADGEAAAVRALPKRKGA